MSTEDKSSDKYKILVLNNILTSFRCDNEHAEFPINMFIFGVNTHTTHWCHVNIFVIYLQHKTQSAKRFNARRVKLPPKIYQPQ